MASKATPDEGHIPQTFDEGDDWEWTEESDDNGTLINFEVGNSAEGRFVRRTTIDLPEDKWQDRNGELQKSADMLVFEKDERRWCTWITYQLNRVGFVPQDYYKLECIDERKSSQGSVKIFSVKHRVNK